MIYKLSDLNRKNFNAIEFYGSRTARLHKIENTPKEQATLENLDILADKAQEMRDLINKPIHITSGYRSLELNQTLPGSASDSYHMYGLAFDFVIGGMTPIEICKFFSNKIRCDKMIASYSHGIEKISDINDGFTSRSTTNLVKTIIIFYLKELRMVKNSLKDYFKSLKTHIQDRVFLLAFVL